MHIPLFGLFERGHFAQVLHVICQSSSEDVKSEKKVTIKEEENTEQTQEETQKEPDQTDTT